MELKIKNRKDLQRAIENYNKNVGIISSFDKMRFDSLFDRAISFKVALRSAYEARQDILAVYDFCQMLKMIAAMDISGFQTHSSLDILNQSIIEHSPALLDSKAYETFKLAWEDNDYKQMESVKRFIKNCMDEDEESDSYHR